MTEVVGELLTDGQRGVVHGDSGLDAHDWEMRQVALPFLAPAAQVVGVAAASAAGGLGVDGPRSAAVAEELVLQIMEQHPVSLAPLRAGLHDFLHPAELVRGLQPPR